MPTILPELPKVEAAIIEITNTVRGENKLAPVMVSAQLTAAARAYANLLAGSGKFSHDADGSLTDRTQRAGYQHCLAAENLALHQSGQGFATRALAVSAMEGWLNSPGHRKNIMTGEMTETGVAVAKAPGDIPKYIAVQLFGRPQSMSISFQVSNTTSETVSFAFNGKARDLSPHLSITMNSCSGGPLTFEKKGAKAFAAKYDAMDGTNYVVTGTVGQPSLRVEVSRRHTVK